MAGRQAPHPKLMIPPGVRESLREAVNVELEKQNRNNNFFANAGDTGAKLEALGTGYVIHTAAGTYRVGTITGTTNQVSVANGDGVAGNTVLSLPQNIHTAASPTFAGLTLSGLTAKAPIYADANKLLATLPLTNGQLVIGSTGAIPVAAGLTAGLNISITPGAGSVTVAATGLPTAAFTTIDVPSGTDPVADSASDTLTFANGYGMSISGDSGTDTVTPAVSLTTAAASLGVDVTMTLANTWYDGPSILLAAGTWYITGAITVQLPGTGVVTARLWDGTTTESSGSSSVTADPFTATTLIDTIPLPGLVVLGSSTTYKLSAASTVAASTIKAAAVDNGVGNNASHIHAVRIA
mgnify:CR=1 FL=1